MMPCNPRLCSDALFRNMAKRLELRATSTAIPRAGFAAWGSPILTAPTKADGRTPRHPCGSRLARCALRESANLSLPFVLVARPTEAFRRMDIVPEKTHVEFDVQLASGKRRILRRCSQLLMLIRCTGGAPK